MRRLTPEGGRALARPRAERPQLKRDPLGRHAHRHRGKTLSAATDRIDALIEEYLAGNQRFMRFWTAFMECWSDADLSEGELEAYGEAYDVVYMGAEGPIAARDSTVGLLNESELKARLREFRKRRTGAPPA